MLCPRQKLECLSIFICLLVLTLMYNCTEVSEDGIGKQEPCADPEGGLVLKAGKDYDGFAMEVLETTTAAKFERC
jgi:hypothetical protein